MPRSRLLLLVWVFGVVVLLGAWGHSLVRKSVLRFDQPRAGVRLSLGVVGGSLEFVRASMRGKGPNNLRFLTYRLEKGAIPGPVPDYKLGRFHHRRFEVGVPPFTLYQATWEVPLWSLLLLWSLLCYPLHRHFRRKARTPPHDPGTAPRSSA